MTFYLHLKNMNKKLFHFDLIERWKTLSYDEQMANIGSEVGRSINWRKKGNAEMSTNALYRALELIDFTLADPKHTTGLKEITRLREILIDYSIGNNIYHSSEKGWTAYFYPFNSAARRNR